MSGEKFSYWELFKSTFLISAFTVGGGFVIVPLLRAKFVDHYKWMSEKEALEMVAVAQSCPGVVAVNSAIIMGYKLAGLSGALCAVAATILPPLITLTIISYFYEFFAANYYIQKLLQGMQCGATAIIIAVLIDMVKKEVKKKLLIPVLIMLCSFAGSYFFNVNIMFIVVIDALVGLFFLRDHKYD